MRGQIHERVRVALPAAATAAVALFVAALVWQSNVWPQATAMALWVYWGVFSVVWALLSALAWRLGATITDASAGGRMATSDGAANGSFARAALVILVIALLARLITALLTQPLLSDDIWRYIHDGATLARGGNPYATAPAELTRQSAPVPEAWSQLNNAELVTIYQPASQYVFALLEMIHARTPAMFRALDPVRDHTYRLGMVGFDLVVIALLLWQLYSAGRSPWWAALYGWHPLAISEVAASGHQDVIGIACLVGALAAVHGLERAKPGGVSAARADASMLSAALGGGLLALAVAVKPIVLPLALPMAWRVGRAQRGGWRLICIAMVAATGIGAACYLPLVWMDGGLERMFETARTFVDKWAFNGSLHALAQWMIGDKLGADRLMGAGLLATLAAVTLARCDVWRAAGVYLLAGVLLSSTVHPWYVLWALALVAVRFDLVTWVLSLTVVLSYEAHLHPEVFKPAAWVAWAVYVPVYAALAVVGARWAVRRWRGAAPAPG